jgi:small subunit ribosomal protein S12
MLTLHQSLLKTKQKKQQHSKAPALLGAPHSKGHVMRLRIVTPKKPNSARRPVAKVILFKKYQVVKRKRVTAYIPGSGHNLRRYSNVLIRGGRARDLPGVGYKCCRNVYDFAGLYKKTKRRSIYGTKKTEGKKKIRRSLRQMFSS